MDFLNKLIGKTVVEKAKNAAVLGLINHMEVTRSVDALVNKSTANYILFIKKKSMSVKRAFTVYDKNQNKKYIIKTSSLTFGYPCIHLYDTENQDIGEVVLTSKTGMGTYTISLDGKELGTLTRKISVNVILDLDFNGWHLEGNLMQNTFVVTDRNRNQVMKFNKAFSDRDTYVLELNNREHEILGLLLVMTVEIALHGKN